MKKLLLIALIAFGAPTQSFALDPCGYAYRSLADLIFGGAPYEVLQSWFAGNMREAFEKEELNYDARFEVATEEIYALIGERKLSPLYGTHRGDLTRADIDRQIERIWCREQQLKFWPKDL